METTPTMINSCVHVIMYSYYFLSTFKSLAYPMKLLKPLITALQIVQLVVLVGHCTVAIMPSCNATKLYHLSLLNLGILIFMFGRFYAKSYIKKKEM